MNLLNKVNKSRETILDMLDLRGFDLEKYKNTTIDELNIMLNNSKEKSTELLPLDIVCYTKDSPKKTCIVKYLMNKIRVDRLKSIISEIHGAHDLKDNDTIIFIIGGVKVPNINQYYSELNYYETNLFIQIFSIDNLLVNISKHVIVPKLRILNNEEKLKVKEEYNIEKMTQFPLILKTDPQAKFYGVKNNDLCEIIRKSETSGTYKSYRYCE